MHKNLFIVAYNKVFVTKSNNNFQKKSLNKMSTCERCSEEVQKFNKCSECRASFCSLKCLLIHFKANHQKSTPLSPTRSPLLKKKNLLTNKKNIVTGVLVPMKPYQMTQGEFSEFEVLQRKGSNVLLGSGAYGDVYLSRHKPTNKLYAMKQLNKKLILSKISNLEPIRREIEIHSKLFHKNIIHLFGYYENSNFFYIILEYSNKGSLYSTIKKKGITNEYQCFNYFTQICSAVLFLHENNLIHRDIKPENILLNDKGEVKLCDFGCCNQNIIGNRSTVCGTYEYMAPEILKENSYNNSVDIWSLGVLLYEMSHGYSPFNMQKNGGKTSEVVMKNIIQGKLEFATTIIGEEGKNLIKKMLVYSPNKRIKILHVFEEDFFKKYEEKENSTIDANFVKIIDTKKELQRMKNRLNTSRLLKSNCDIEVSISQALRPTKYTIRRSDSVSTARSMNINPNYLSNLNTTKLMRKPPINNVNKPTKRYITPFKSSEFSTNSSIKQKKTNESNKSNKTEKPKNSSIHSHYPSFTYHLHQNDKNLSNGEKKKKNKPKGTNDIKKSKNLFGRKSENRG